MKQLPKYFAIERDKTSPLWDVYEEWLQGKKCFCLSKPDSDQYYIGPCDTELSNKVLDNIKIISLEEWNEAANGKPDYEKQLEATDIYYESKINELLNHVEELNKRIDAYWNNGRQDSLAKKICEEQQVSSKLLKSHGR